MNEIVVVVDVDTILSEHGVIVVVRYFINTE